MEHQPLVTIVTPSYNQAAYLEDTIRSVLAQDYPNIEYLVVDGASTDASVEIIRKYASRISWWVSEKDGGQSDAVNKGFRRAKGEYVGWLNSDDVYEPGAVTSAVAAFAQHPGLGLVYGDARSIDAGGRQYNLMRASQYNLADLLAFNIICQPASFMRRSVLEQVGFLDPDYHLLMDHLLWARMACNTAIQYVPEVWASARYHDQAKNRTRGAEYGREAKRLISDLDGQAEYKEVIREHSRSIWAGVHRFDAFYLTDAGQYPAALRAYGRSFWLHPRTVAKDWKHAVLALLGLLGLKKMRRWYESRRARRFAE